MQSLKDRFEKKEELIEALQRQRIVMGDRALAESLAGKGEFIDYAPGANIIEQGANDRDLYFLLAGKGQVIVNGTRLYAREHGSTVGEMSAINPHIGRSATIEASDHAVAWKISHTRLAEVGKAFPDIWRRIAIELSSRLEQRNQFINRVNKTPRVFLICSAEALPIAKAIRVGLEHDAQVEIWSDENIFPPGSYAIEALEDQVDQADFGIALAEPDDVVRSRHRQSATPRDNVVFELGFFMSRLGRHRTLLLVPRNKDQKLPSDFKGLTPIEYTRPDTLRNLGVILGPSIDRISTIIRECGVRSSFTITR